MTLIQFDSVSGARIGDAVRFVESQANRRGALRFSEVPPSASRPVFRVGTFNSAWPKDASRTVTLRSGSTVSAMNLFADIATAVSVRDCAIAREGTAWYLIAAEC